MRMKSLKVLTPLLYLGLAAGVMLESFGPGCVALYDLSPITSIAQLDRPYRYPWDDLQNLGLPVVLAGNAVYNAPLKALSMLVGSVEVGHKLYLVTILGLAGLGMKLLSSRLGFRRDASTLAGCLYLLSFWTMYRLGLGHNTLLLGYAILPYALERYVAACGGGRPSLMVQCSIASAALVWASPHIAYVLGVALITWELVLIYLAARGGSLIRAVKALMLRIILIPTLCAILTLPLLVNYFTLSSPIYVVRSEEVYYYFSPSITPGAIAVYIQVTLFTLILAIGRRVKRVKKPILYASTLVVSGLLLQLLSFELFKPVYRSLFFLLPGFSMFRDLGKFLLLSVIGLSLLAAGSASSLTVKLRDRRVATACLTLLIIIPAVACYNEYVDGRLRPVKVPEYYAQLNHLLEKDSGDYRIAYIPPATWATVYDWQPHWFLDPAVSLQVKPTVEVRSELDATLSADVVRWIYTSIYHNLSNRVGGLLGLVGARYVVVRHDAHLPAYRKDLATLTLNRSTIGIQLLGLKRVAQLDRLEVYENEAALPHIFASSGVALVAGTRRVILAALHWNLTKAPLVFLDNTPSIRQLFNAVRLLVLEGNRGIDLALAYAETALNPVKINPYFSEGDVRDKWVPSPLVWWLFNGSLLFHSNQLLFTLSGSELSIPIRVAAPGLYSLYVKPYVRGEGDGFNVAVDGKPVSSLKLGAPSSFNWVKACEVNLDSATHKVSILPKGSVGIASVALVKQEDLSAALKALTAELEERGIGVLIVLEEAAWHGVNGTVKRGPIFSCGAALSRGQYVASFYAPREGVYELNIYASNGLSEVMIEVGGTAIKAVLNQGLNRVEALWLPVGEHELRLDVVKGEVDLVTLTLKPEQPVNLLPVRYVKLSPSIYEVEVPVGANYLVFLEAFNPGWVLRGEASSVSPTVTYSYASGFPLNKPGKYALTYKGYEFFTWSAAISFTMFPAALLLLFLGWRVRRC